MLKINNKFIVVAFATLGTPYEKIIEACLIPSLKKFNLEYHIEVVNSLGSWQKNVAMKPKIILSALEKYPNRQIICLDADSELTTYPSLFNTISLEYDFGCHFLNWNTWYGYNQNPPTIEVLSGTVWVNNTENAKKILTDWAHKSEHSNIWEQKILGEILETSSAKVYKLPVEYCYISSLPNGNPPIYTNCTPVILHHQASRTLKKKIK